MINFIVHFLLCSPTFPLIFRFLQLICSIIFLLISFIPLNFLQLATFSLSFPFLFIFLVVKLLKSAVIFVLWDFSFPLTMLRAKILFLVLFRSTHSTSFSPTFQLFIFSAFQFLSILQLLFSILSFSLPRCFSKVSFLVHKFTLFSFLIFSIFQFVFSFSLSSLFVQSFASLCWRYYSIFSRRL